MFGKNSRLSPLASRKKLLLAESELNREQMLRQWQGMTAEVRVISGQARTLGTLAAVATVVAAALAAFRHGKAPPVAEKNSWLSVLLKGAGWTSWLWQKVKPPAPKK